MAASGTEIDYYGLSRRKIII